MKERKSPQEKKQLSYTKDRRNFYGENDKSSRKNIPRNKRNRHRSERQRGQQQLSAALGAVDEDVEVDLDDRLTRTRRGIHWRKAPDEQLGVYVANRLKRRLDMGISAAHTEQARIEKVSRNTRVDGLGKRRNW